LPSSPSQKRTIASDAAANSASVRKPTAAGGGGGGALRSEGVGHDGPDGVRPSALFESLDAVGGSVALGVAEGERRGFDLDAAMADG
jgi:hypothetical protein